MCGPLHSGAAYEVSVKYSQGTWMEVGRIQWVVTLGWRESFLEVVHHSQT